MYVQTTPITTVPRHVMSQNWHRSVVIYAHTRRHIIFKNCDIDMRLFNHILRVKTL